MILDFIFYLIAGALTGLLSGLFGVGGGIIIVGLLNYQFHRLSIDDAAVMHIALGTSLATIIFTSISSSRAHHLKKNVNWQVFLQLTPYIVVGTLAGAYIASMLNTMWLKAIFASFVMMVSAKLLLAQQTSNEGMLGDQYQSSSILNLIAGLSIGIVSSLVGIGGGTLMVPYLNHCKINMRLAIGTSAAIGLPIAIAGTIGFIYNGLHADMAKLPDHSVGFVYLPAFVGIAITSVMTAPLGARLAHVLPISTLKKLFGLLLMLVGLKMIWGII